MRIHPRQILKHVLFTAFAFSSISVVGQDELADVAPIDKKLKAIDSVALVRLVHEEESLAEPAANLYPDWTHEYVARYNVEIPSEYKIDLRGFHMPCDNHTVTSHFGYRRRFRRQHYGTDIKVYVGDTIRAAFDGKIRVVDTEWKGYGRYVIIRHPNGLETLYGHMSKHLVKEDQVVKAGEPIGLGGNTGRSYGSHLHFETRFLGQFINPEKMFNFEAQDVMGDYFMFRSNGRGALLAAHENVGGESEMSEEEAKMLAKADESRAFQEKQIEKQRSKARTHVHKVRSGENLSVIAKKYGISVQKLCRLNNITEKTILRVGQILKYS